MVIRFNTTCPRCGKENSVFGNDIVCKDCKLKGYFKAQIRTFERNKELRKELREMAPKIKKELHAKILKELLEEEE